MLWHQIVGGLLGAGVLTFSSVILIRAENVATRMRGQARMRFGRWLDEDALELTYNRWSIGLGAVGGVLLGLLMIVLGVLGLYA